VPSKQAAQFGDLTVELKLSLNPRSLSDRGTQYT
jgi:hypothetical protein